MGGGWGGAQGGARNAVDRFGHAMGYCQALVLFVSGGGGRGGVILKKYEHLFLSKIQPEQCTLFRCIDQCYLSSIWFLVLRAQRKFLHFFVLKIAAMSGFLVTVEDQVGSVFNNFNNVQSFS